MLVDVFRAAVPTLLVAHDAQDARRIRLQHLDNNHPGAPAKNSQIPWSALPSRWRDGLSGLRDYPGRVHKTLGQRDPASAFPLAHGRDDADERRQANRAVAVSAVGLGATGLVELLLALVTGSVGLLGDAIHNLSDVSTSAVVFLGFRLSRRPPTEKYPYGLERAEDLAGVGIAVVIWASAAFAGFESIRKLLQHGHTAHVAAGIAGAVLGIIGNQAVAWYKLRVGKRINSATLIADAKHSWLDALSSAGALTGLVAVAFGLPWGDPVAGLAVTAFICHVGYEVTKDVVHRLADGVDPDIITTAEAAAGSVPGVIHAHARARWTGRTLRVEIEGWVDPELPAKDADALGRLVADQLSHQRPQAGSFTWTTRAAPA
jgi:cation diffusion facilitator family transporter